MRIDFTMRPNISHDDFLRNTEYSSRLAVRKLEDLRAGGGNLAVVGGGHSVANHIDTLKAWPDEIWAVNGAYHWCRDHGIDATFYTIDAMPDWTPYACGAKRAVVAASCHPSLFDELSGAEIFTFEQNKVLGGSTSATFAPTLAIKAGFHGVMFFGCESSYADNKTHIYENEVVTNYMRVAYSGLEFETNANYFLQAETLAAMIREFPDLFKERSGGLLSAMIVDPEYDVVAVGRDLAKRLTPIESEANV